MADDYGSESTLVLCQEPKRSEIPAALNMPNQTFEEPPKSSSSDLINDVAEESRLNPVSLPNDFDNAIWQKTDCMDFGEERDQGLVCDVVPHVHEENVEKAENAARETVLMKQEGKGFEEEEEKMESGCAAPVCLNDRVLGKQQLKSGCFDRAVLGKEESNLDMNGALLENSEKGVSGSQDGLEFSEKMNNWGNSKEGSLKKCSLKIAVIDETALVESSGIAKGFRKERKIVKNLNNNEQENGGNREKRPRRRGKSGKNKNLGNHEKEKNLDLGHTDCGIRITEACEKKRQKNVYSRKELEELRHVGLESQRKKWAEVYCGLGPVVQQEYDGLVGYDYHHQYYDQKQKKYIHVDLNGGPPIFSEESSENIGDKEIAMENPMDFTSGLPAANIKTGCLTEQGEYIEDNSDEDYSSIQKPAFFVSGEPNFDSGPPEDGLEYLRRVRWEAAQMPQVNVAKIDKSKLKKEQTNYMPQIPNVAKCPEHLMPLKEWEDAFLADFSELRLALSRYGNCEEPLQSFAVYKEESSSKLFEGALENFDNVSFEGDFCQATQCSISQTRDDPHFSSVANDNDGSGSTEGSSSKLSERGASVEYPPTLSVIIHMDSVARVSALRKRINMAESMNNLSWNDCLWLFALSAAVDCPLDADTCAAFRSLLRKCAALRAEKLVVDEEVAMLNTLVTISGRYFGQLEN